MPVEDGSVCRRSGRDRREFCRQALTTGWDELLLQEDISFFIPGAVKTAELAARRIAASKLARVGEAPQRGLEAVHDVARPLDFGFVLARVGAVSDRLDVRRLDLK